ncbi:MAG: hypothetical protein LBQ14_02270 [Treponema sp.]|jgi:hypothetical protein|nr:hypothetical protein [Treponema sp.]
MRTGLFLYGSLAALFVLLFCSCGASGDNIAPPLTSPLSRPLIGYGVVTVSYTSVVDQPNLTGGVSLGILRMGTVVPVLERRRINVRGTLESWIRVEGYYQGWLREEVLEIFENEAQAKTAAGAVFQ